MPVDDDAVDHLFRLTAGHPYLIQYMLKKVVDKSIREGKAVITRDAIIHQENHMIKEGPAFDACFGVLDSDYSVQEVLSTNNTMLGKGLLSLIAKRGDDDEQGWVSHEVLRTEMVQLGCKRPQTDELIKQLVAAKIVEEGNVDHSLCFRMTIPLLRKRYREQNFFLKYFHGARN